MKFTYEFRNNCVLKISFEEYEFLGDRVHYRDDLCYRYVDCTTATGYLNIGFFPDMVDSFDAMFLEFSFRDPGGYSILLYKDDENKDLLNLWFLFLKEKPWEEIYREYLEFKLRSTEEEIEEKQKELENLFSYRDDLRKKIG